jgi:nitrate reductase delta subunit
VTDYETALQQWLAGTDASGERAAVPAAAPGTGPKSAAGFARKGPAHGEALERVRAWTRARFGLPADDVILVSELACTLPGCAPLETVVAFWTETDKRHHFKIFKPVAEVVADDLPPAWLKEALAVPEGGDCECC